MTFEEILDQAMAMLQRHGRVAYRTLKRQFTLDDTALEDLKEAILFAHPQVVDEAGRGLIWSAPSAVHPAPVAPPPAIPQPLDAERRHSRCCSADLVGSTPLSPNNSTPKTCARWYEPARQTCAAVIQRFDGHMAQLLGDALLVYFGWPRAHEDDAQRAVRTGVGLLEAMRILNARLERRTCVWAFAWACIQVWRSLGRWAAGRGHREQLALGETPNIASRLQGLADPDTVLLSADTYRLVQGYFTRRGPWAQVLKGVARAAASRSISVLAGERRPEPSGRCCRCPASRRWWAVTREVALLLEDAGHRG